MKSKLSLVTLFQFLVITSFASSISADEIIFNKLLPQDGSNFNYVTGIVQDENGNMWFSTKKGLYRYDGIQIKLYNNNPFNSNTLASNLSESLATDKNGYIWIGSLGKGLDRLDPETGLFSNYTHNNDDPGSISNDTVTTILSDSDGILWVGTHGGLDRYDPENNSFTHFRHDVDDDSSLSDNQVRTLFEDGDGIIWIGTGSPYPLDGGTRAGGLNKLDKSTGIITRYQKDTSNPESLANNNISSIYEDSEGTLWIGTQDAILHKMNRQEGTFERQQFHNLSLNRTKSLPVNEFISDYEHITTINQDTEGNYWFGTVENGLFLYNAETGKLENLSGEGYKNNKFHEAGAWVSYNSSDGLTWIGTAGGNIYYINPYQKKIPHIDLGGSSGLAFLEDRYGNLWIGTNRELIRNNKYNGDEKIYHFRGNHERENNIGTENIYEDSKGDIWIGGISGLAKWDRDNDKFLPVYADKGVEDDVKVIFEDREFNFWFGTASGLKKLDRNTGLVSSFYKDPNNKKPMGQNFLPDMLQDKNGDLWTTYWFGGGVWKFDPLTFEFKNHLENHSISNIHEDDDGVLWAGGYEGLFKFNPSEDKFEQFDYIDLLYNPISDVRGIIGDDENNLWITSALQIHKLNSERNEINVFGEKYGIEDYTFSYLAQYFSKDGDIYFGLDEGYLSFNPEKQNIISKPPELKFTKLTIQNEMVRPGRNSLLRENLSEVQEIVLTYNQNVFSIEFSVVDYLDPEGIVIQYMLDNYDTDWRSSKSHGKAYYFNIKPGKYVFRANAINGDGLWNRNNLVIIISPPWYYSWWAYMIYGIALVILLYGAHKFQKARTLRIERERSQKRELEQAKEIEQAYRELKATQSQLIQSEKMASLGELTAGIAHEIQNPLNFVNNFSELNAELIEEMQKELKSGEIEEAIAISNDIRENENKIKHHGKRAEGIVKGMLQHSRDSSGEKELTDINALADEYLRLSYHGIRAKDKSFNADFKIELDRALPKIKVVPQDIGRVLLNLINNAFYAVDKMAKEGRKDYSPLVIVKTKMEVSTYEGADDGRIKIVVSDNGPGIPKNIKDKIFQPFFTTKPTGQGTGLGLSISYDIIQAHGGSLQVESKLDFGTEFIIELPLI